MFSFKLKKTIERPHNPIVDTLLEFLRYSTITSTSSLSNHPKEIYSPNFFFLNNNKYLNIK